MGSILNGMALSQAAALRIAVPDLQRLLRAAHPAGALMEMPVIYIFTHDSIGVGEDGPTHQPVEQLISLRAIPGLIVLRPGDANEVAEAWRSIMQLRHEPVCADPVPPEHADARPDEICVRRQASPKAPTSWRMRPAESRR